MKSVTKDIVRYEFIGKKAKVVESKNKYNVGIEGTIIDETKNMFTIRKENGEKKKIMKQNNVFEIMIKNNLVKIKGDLLIGRPEDRIKMKIR